MTNYTPTFKGTLDYIWYTTANLSVNSVLGEVDQGYLDKVVGFPNAHFPSEYVVSPVLCVMYVVLMMMLRVLVTCVLCLNSASVHLGRRSPLARRRSSRSRPRAHTIEGSSCPARAPLLVLCGLYPVPDHGYRPLLFASARLL